MSTIDRWLTTEEAVAVERERWRKQSEQDRVAAENDRNRVGKERDEAYRLHESAAARADEAERVLSVERKKTGMLETEVGELRARSEAAARKRADALAALAHAAHVTSGLETMLRAAEADNAALLKAGRDMHDVAQDVMRHEKREKLRYELLAVFEAEHPGAQLLEELNRLRILAKRIRAHCDDQETSFTLPGDAYAALADAEEVASHE